MSACRYVFTILNRAFRLWCFLFPSLSLRGQVIERERERREDILTSLMCLYVPIRSTLSFRSGDSFANRVSWIGFPEGRPPAGFRDGGCIGFSDECSCESYRRRGSGEERGGKMRGSGERKTVGTTRKPCLHKQTTTPSCYVVANHNQRPQTKASIITMVHTPFCSLWLFLWEAFLVQGEGRGRLLSPPRLNFMRCVKSRKRAPESVLAED